MDELRSRQQSGYGRGGLLTAILVGSVVLHLGILMVLGLRAATPETSPSIPYAPIFLEMASRPLLKDEAAQRPAPTPDAPAGRRSSARKRAETLAQPPLDAPAQASSTTIPSALPAVADPWRVTRSRSGDARVHPPRLPPIGCRDTALGRSAAEQALCDQRFGDAAARTRALGPRQATSAEARRDARFALDGAAALEAFEERERPLAPNARARPCPPGPSPSDPCAVAISGRIWSSRDGWFPDLPGRR